MAYVCVVTGATGFVGSELVKQLLERGWCVRACVRDTSNAHRVEPLLRLAAALPGTLQLVECDLQQEGSFHSACAGVQFVFHGAPALANRARGFHPGLTPTVVCSRVALLLRDERPTEGDRGAGGAGHVERAAGLRCHKSVAAAGGAHELRRG